MGDELYKIKIIAGYGESVIPEDVVMLYTNKGMVFVKIHPVKVKATPKVDAVEVVRCKDCKHYGYDPYDNGDKCCDRWGEWIFPNDDDFCSGGERKEK